MILTPTMMMQIVPLFGQFAGAAIGGKKGKRIAKQSAALGGLLGMAGNIGKAFGSSSLGTSTTTEGTDLRNSLTIDGVDQSIFNFGRSGNILRIPGIGIGNDIYGA